VSRSCVPLVYAAMITKLQLVFARLEKRKYDCSACGGTYANPHFPERKYHYLAVRKEAETGVLDVDEEVTRVNPHQHGGLFGFSIIGKYKGITVTIATAIVPEAASRGVLTTLEGVYKKKITINLTPVDDIPAKIDCP